MDKNKFYKAMFKCCADKGDWRVSLTGINYVVSENESILTATDSHMLVQAFFPSGFAPSDFDGKTKLFNGCDVYGKFPNVKAVIPTCEPDHSYKYSIKELINICNFMLKHKNGIYGKNPPKNRLDFNGAYINVKYLKTVLNVLSLFASDVIIEVRSSELPLMLKIKDSQTFGLIMPALKYDIDSNWDAPDAKVEYKIEETIELMDAKPIVKGKMWYE